jgi:hypothetical protein
MGNADRKSGSPKPQEEQKHPEEWLRDLIWIWRRRIRGSSRPPAT